MRLPTILNRVEKFQSFVDGEASLEPCDDALALVVPREPRKNGRGYGSSWGRPGPADDRLEQGRFEFVPVWGILVFLAERLRRVNCRRCGVTVAMVPWCDGENPLTTTYRGDRAAWAKRLSGSAVGSIFRTSWDSVRRAVECAVECGLAHRDLHRTAWGLDAIAGVRGHTDWTRVDDRGGQARRLLAVAEGRTEARLRSGLEGRGKPVGLGVKSVCGARGKPDLNVIAARLGQAVHVLDRCHVMPQFGTAWDERRAAESKRWVRDGDEPVWKKSRWWILKRPENLTEKPTVTRSERVQDNLRTVRADRLREELPRLWESKSGWWAGKFLDEWTGGRAACCVRGGRR